MELITRRIPGTKWLKAAVIASYWSAFEIIVGSFLHNLRLPLAGTILSFASVVLIVSFSTVWKEKGLIWRAGLICALLKSISPSAIILGPMIGIVLEALLIEIFTWVIGYNLIGFAAGGALAVFSALIHKVVTLLILYGFDLIRIAEALYRYLTKQINFDRLDPLTFIYCVSGIYLIAGISAAILGYITGVKIRKMTRDKSNLIEYQLDNENSLNYETRDEKYNVWLLFLNICILITLLYLINSGFFIFSISVALVYVLFIFYRYRKSLKRLKKPAFWLQFLIITLIASLLLEGITNGAFLSKRGLIIGLNMNFRAIILILGFSAISTELRNPFIKALTYRNGLSGLYQSMSLSFSALPAVVKDFPGMKAMISQPVNSLALMFYRAEQLIRTFESQLKKRPDIIVLTGERQQGKTTFLKNLIPVLSSKGLNVAGILAPAIHIEGKRIGFDILDITSGEQLSLCRINAGNNLRKYQRFTFIDEGLKLGRRILSPENLQSAQVVIIDEVGPLEMNNEGWADSIRKLCEVPDIIQIWTVRKQMTRQVAVAWPVGDVHIFDIAEVDPSALAEYIINLKS